MRKRSGSNNGVSGRKRSANVATATRCVSGRKRSGSGNNVFHVRKRSGSMLQNTDR
ncbi:hypothetical protein [Lysinibacillus sp. G4S2]|uniref:hypothetical protein n=1 Tax=Lysinibacillus sp. G4S2 TaxID=3055859 RepID=UPI0025A240B1|nr:hypothetical protein [Lysinibacillus sp. G4S2]MDM5246557.1 hypothetical protein [Lysinibacillus sp. G4S2]